MILTVLARSRSAGQPQVLWSVEEVRRFPVLEIWSINIYGGRPDAVVMIHSPIVTTQDNRDIWTLGLSSWDFRIHILGSVPRSSSSVRWKVHTQGVGPVAATLHIRSRSVLSRRACFPCTSCRCWLYREKLHAKTFPPEYHTCCLLGRCTSGMINNALYPSCEERTHPAQMSKSKPNRKSQSACSGQ